MKSHQRIIMGILVLSLGLSLCGCRLLLQSEFYDEQAHGAKQAATTDPSVYSEGIGSYEELKSNVLNLVQMGIQQSSLKIFKYSGNVDEDIKRVVREVTGEEPLGLYVVRSIIYEQKKLFNYSEIELSIYYSKPYYYIRNVVPIVTVQDFRQRISNLFSKYSKNVSFLINDFDEDVYDPIATIYKVYYQLGDFAYGLSNVSIKYYPEDGRRRILEINIDYVNSEEILKERAKQADEKAREIVASLPRGDDPYKFLLEIHDYLIQTVSLDASAEKIAEDSQGNYPRTNAYTAYGALINQTAASEGYALAFKQMCDIAGVECYVVIGEQNGVQTYWNLVKTAGRWYHVDCAADDMGDYSAKRYFCVTDTVIGAARSWDRNYYPHT